MSKRHLYVLALVLCLVGLSLFLYKAMVFKFPLAPDTTTSLWNVEAHIAFTAKGQPAKISLYLPKRSDRYAVVDENFLSRGFGLTMKKVDGNRQAVWSIRRVSGPQSLYYRALIRQLEFVGPEPSTKPPPLPEIQFTGPALDAAQALLSDIHARSADVETFVGDLLVTLRQVPAGRRVAFLLGQDPTDMMILESAQQLLALERIPGRLVHGVRLENLRVEAPLVHWLEVYEKGTWRLFDPTTGEAKPEADFLPWWRGHVPLVVADGADKLQVTLSVAMNQEEAVAGAVMRSQLMTPTLLKFSLFSLPLETQSVYRILLMVPLGAFLLVILRNVVGVKTFGTFMPILIALAFRETKLMWGIVLFTLLVGIGLTVRFYLEHLKLLLVPRLAAILIIVILMMVGLSVVSHQLGLERGLSVALFPMVILTMTIERMC
ncbi:MAG: UUP1 family membrane protein, partial [Nitrospirales bacterium]